MRKSLNDLLANKRVLRAKIIIIRAKIITLRNWVNCAKEIIIMSLNCQVINNSETFVLLHRPDAFGFDMKLSIKFWLSFKFLRSTTIELQHNFYTLQNIFANTILAT